MPVCNRISASIQILYGHNQVIKISSKSRFSYVCNGFLSWLFRSKIQSQPPIRQNPKYSTNLAYTTSIGQFFELKTIKTSFGAAGWSLEVVSQFFNFDPKSWCTPLKHENRIFEGSWKSGFVGSHDLKFYTSVSYPESEPCVKFEAITLDKTIFKNHHMTSILATFQISVKIWSQGKFSKIFEFL